jgi:flagellar motor switch protein FliG
VFHEFSGLLQQGAQPRGGPDVARVLLQEAVGDAKAKEALSRNLRQPFSAIVDVPDEDLAVVLGKEQPAVTALVLAYLPPKKTAAIVVHLDPDTRAEVVGRLVNAHNADPDTTARIERVFVQKVASLIQKSKGGERNSSLGGPKFIANVLQHIDRETEEQLLKVIQEISAEKATAVRDLMFTFEDIVRLSDTDMQKVLRGVSMDKLTIALRGAAPPIYNKVANNLSKHAQESLREEMELLGRLKLSQVREEQRNLVNVIRALEAAGEISLNTGQEDEVYV